MQNIFERERKKATDCLLEHVTFFLAIPERKATPQRQMKNQMDMYQVPTAPRPRASAQSQRTAILDLRDFESIVGVLKSVFRDGGTADG